MVATTDAMISGTLPHRAVFAPVRTVDGARWLARGAQRFAGTVLLLAMAGIWIQPGAAFDQDIMLFKLALSAFLGLAGMALIRGGRPEPSVEIEIDLDRDELRLVRPQPTAFAAPIVVHTCAFSDLVSVDVVSQMVRLWDADGSLMAEVPMSDPETRSTLMQALSAHGKI